MIGEGEPLQNSNGAATKLERAKEAVQSATQTVKATTQSVADAIDAGRQPGAPLDRLAEWAKAAPLQALAVAFVVGVMVGRRR
jgi:ElaB/YqjD/DUF883 family membrane-anchored ribosome-binding protein